MLESHVLLHVIMYAFCFKENTYFSSFCCHMSVIIAKFPHYSELFTFSHVAIHSESLFVRPQSSTTGVRQFLSREPVQILLIKA